MRQGADVTGSGQDMSLQETDTPDLVLVDGLRGLETARADWPDATIATDNPYLAVAQPTCLSADGALSQDEILALAKAALEAYDRLLGALNAPAAAETLGFAPGTIGFGQAPFVLLATLLRRGLVVSRLAARLGARRILVVGADEPAFDPAHPILPNRFGTPVGALAEAGFFEQAFRFQPVAEDVPSEYNNTQTTNPFLRFLALRPIDGLTAVLLRAGLGRLIPARPVAQVGLNEAMREAILPLLLRRLRLERQPGPPTLPAADAQRVKTTRDRLAAAVPQDWPQSIVDTGLVTDPQARAVARMLLDRMAHEIAQVLDHDGRLRAYTETLSRAAPATRTVVTNGWHGLIGHRLHWHAREAGLRTICFEHGVTVGLALENRQKIRHLEGATCDLMLVATRAAAQDNADAGRALHARSATIGLAEQTRSVTARPVQRWIARRSLGITSRQRPVLMHIATHTRIGGLTTLVHQTNDTGLLDFERKLWATAYVDLPYEIFYKPYPTRRMVFEPGLFELLPDVQKPRVIPDFDFRYIRTAADVIVTYTPTSTLGWCCGADVPLVWLDSRALRPLADDDLRDRFSRAFLTVDLDRPDWPQRLRMLLDRPLPDLLADWQSRRSARTELLDGWVFGPTGAGRNAAEEIVRDMKARGVQSS